MHSNTGMHLRLLHPVSPEGRFGFNAFTPLRNKAPEITETWTRNMQQTRSHGPRAVSLASLSVARVGCFHFATNVTSETRIETTILACSDSARQNYMSGTSSRFVSVYA